MRGVPPEYGDLEYRGSEEVEGGFSVRQIGEAAERAIGVMKQSAALDPVCESPIEVELGARLKLDLGDRFELRPQYWLGRFRMDFAVMRDGEPVLFIECDGKAWHSTPEQQANDRLKDAASAQARVPLLRFTGSSIYRHPDECCRQIVALLEGLA